MSPLRPIESDMDREVRVAAFAKLARLSPLMGGVLDTAVRGLPTFPDSAETLRIEIRSAS